MNDKNKKEWKGLVALVADVVTNGASAVERVHVATARRPFDVLACVPVVAAPAEIVRTVHDASVVATYVAVRGITRMVGSLVEVAIDAA